MSRPFSALTGKLKSIFSKSNSDNPTVPVLESRKEDNNNSDNSDATNNNLYQTDEHLSKITSETLVKFDEVNFDSDSETTNNLEDNSLNNSPNTSPNSVSSLSTPVFSPELEKMRDDITNSISVSDEEVGEGHVLLSKAFSISDEVLSLINPALIKHYKILPVEVVNSRLSILFVDEIQRQMCEEEVISILVTKGLNYQLHFVLTSEASWIGIIDYLFSTINSNILVAEQERLAEKHNYLIQQMDAEVQTPTTIEFDIKTAKEESPFESILVELFIQTHVKRGTDCNIDLNIIPKRDGTEYTELLVTTRVDNSSVIVKRHPMAVETFIRLMTVLKVLAGLDTAKTRGQLTGYITGRLVYGTRSPKIEMRCHLIPTGRKKISSASIRFQSQHENNFTVKTVGFFTSDEKKLNLHVFHATDGIIIICGRVNCGKNTTLIAFINKLKELHPDKRIIMIEDPIEQTLDGVIQFQIDPVNKDFGFAYFLKEALRHDPDIITVGETRDSESAKLVLDAASAGHLTFTTVHSTDSVKAIERMISLTGDTSKLSDSLRAIISQKLVKTICSKCVREIDTNIPYVERLDDYIAKIGWQAGVQFVRGSGKTSNGEECRQCHGTGLHGRTGIFEILTPSEKMRDLIAKNTPVSKLRQLAIKEGLKSLFLNGLTKALMGEITLAQLIKQTGPPSAEKEGISFTCDADSSGELN